MALPYGFGESRLVLGFNWCPPQRVAISRVVRECCLISKKVIGIIHIPNYPTVFYTLVCAVIFLGFIGFV